MLQHIIRTTEIRNISCFRELVYHPSPREIYFKAPLPVNIPLRMKKRQHVVHPCKAFRSGEGEVNLSSTAYRTDFGTRRHITKSDAVGLKVWEKVAKKCSAGDVRTKEGHRPQRLAKPSDSCINSAQGVGGGGRNEIAH